MLIRPRIVFMSDAGAGGGAGAGAGAGGADGGAGAGAGGGAAPPPAFAETLPEDIRGDAVFRDIKDLPGLAKSYMNATKMIGGRPDDLIKVPATPDDADAWNGVYAKLGRPEKADGYQFTPPKLPDGVQVDTALEGSFRETALKVGLSARQAAALYDWYNGQAGERYAASAATRTQAADTAAAELKKEWGAAYDQKLDTALAGLAHYAGDEFKAFLDQAGLSSDPRMVKVFEKLGAQLQEDGVIGRGGGGGGGALSPAEAQQQINALRTDHTFKAAYMDKANPGHKDAVAKMGRLHEQAYPEPARP